MLSYIKYIVFILLLIFVFASWFFTKVMTLFADFTISVNENVFSHLNNTSMFILLILVFWVIYTIIRSYAD